MIGDGEAIMDEIESVFKSKMGAKITELNAERGDSLLPAFNADSWKKYRLPGNSMMPNYPVSFLQYINESPMPSIIKGGSSVSYNIAIDTIIQASNTENDDKKMLRLQRAIFEVLKDDLTHCFPGIQAVSTDIVQGSDANNQQFLIGQVVISIVVAF